MKFGTWAVLMPVLTAILGLRAAGTESRELYNGCGVRKDCIGAHESGEPCLRTKCCHYFVAFRYDPTSKHIIVEMQSTKVKNYVSVGVSPQITMGDDAVVQCFKDSSGQVRIESSWNEGTQNLPLPQPIYSSVVSKRLEERRLTCTFTLPMTFDTGKGIFDFWTDSYYLSVAGGAVSGNRIQMHTLHGAEVTKIKLNFTQVVVVLQVRITDNDFQVLAIKLHMLGMILTFLFCIPVGIFISRFFKETWADVHVCRRRLWFIYHAGFMLTGLVSGLVGYVIIPISQKGLMLNNYGNLRVHQILGYISLALLVIECLGNWLHIYKVCLGRVVSALHIVFGVLAYGLGLANIGFAGMMVGSHVPQTFGPLVISWTVVLFLFFTLMTGYLYWSDGHMGIDGCRVVTSFPMPMLTDEEAPRPNLRKSMLGVYIVCAIAMVVISAYFIMEETEAPCKETE